MPVVKEPKFFSSQFVPSPLSGSGDALIEGLQVREWDEYRKLFRNAGNSIAVGEASADMLYYHRQSIPLIRKYLGDVRILMLLRNPVDRAFSAYRQLVRDGRESLEFEEALEKEEGRRRENYEYMWHYTRVGFYHDQVKAYLNSFSRTKVILFDDFTGDPEGCLQETFEFLGVDPNEVPETGTRVNVSRVPADGMMRSLFRLGPIKVWVYRGLTKAGVGDGKIFRWLNRIRRYRAKRMRMKPRTREGLVEIYRNDIARLEVLLGRDLSSWLE